MTDTLPRLLDCAALMKELGVKRATAESLMRAVPKIRVGRKVFISRDDLKAELDRRAAA